MNLRNERQKREYKNIILQELGIKSTDSQALGYICGTLALDEDLLRGISQTGANYVIFSKRGNLPKYENTFYIDYELMQDNISGFDFFVCTTGSEQTEYFLQQDIVPIVQTGHYLGTLLHEYLPLTMKGNCFQYSGNDKWSIFAAIVRYLENYKFPRDHDKIIQNIQLSFQY